MTTEATTSDVETETEAPDVADTSTDDQVETQAEDEDIEGDESADDQAEDEDDGLEEIEFEGVKARVPPAIKAGVLRQADYTQKTQALAADRQALETAKQAVVRDVEARMALVADHAKMQTLEEPLAEYEKLSQADWELIKERNPDEYREHRDHFRDLKFERDRIAGDIKTKVEQRSQEEQRQRATALQENVAKLPGLIPGWNAELATKIEQFAITELGYTPDEVMGALADGPNRIRTLHLAMKGLEAEKNKKAVARVTAGQKTTPAKTVGASAPNARRTTDASGDALSGAEWAKRERARVAARAATR